MFVAGAMLAGLAVSSAGLVGHYSFDDPGAVGRDSGSFAIDGALSGQAQFSAVQSPAGHNRPGRTVVQERTAPEPPTSGLRGHNVAQDGALLPGGPRGLRVCCGVLVRKGQ